MSIAGGIIFLECYLKPNLMIGSIYEKNVLSRQLQF